MFAHNISRQLAAVGNDVRVYVPREDFSRLGPQFTNLLMPLPRKFYGVARRVPFLGLYRAQRYLAKEQDREDYDAWLVIRTYPTGYVAACLKGTVPIVLRASGEDIQKSSELGYGLRLNGSQEAKIRRAVRCYDRVVAMTESAREDFLELGVPGEAIVSIPNGVDVGWFTPNREVAHIRAELGWPNDRSLILTTGRNHRKKGFNLIPSIAQNLRDAGFQFRWYVVGLGVNGIDAEITSRGLEDHVMTHGEVGVDALPGAEWRFPHRKLVMMYQAADIFAFPSLLENFAMVVLEAMAAGAVVVSTDAPGCRDVVAHEENGLQARAGNVDSFSEQMSRVLEDADLRRSLSESGREFAEAHSWERVATQYEALFRELAQDRRAGEVAPGIGGAH